MIIGVIHSASFTGTDNKWEIRLMRIGKALVLFLALILCAGTAWAGAPVGVSRFNDEEITVGDRTPGHGGAIVGLGPGMQAAADYIASIQCSVGGWCWENGIACCPNPPANTQGPIILGLLNAYAYTSDPTHLASAELGGSWDMSSQYTNGEYRASAASPWTLYTLTGVPAFIPQ